MPNRIQIICPARPGSRTGNRVTALRWAKMLRSLGRRVRIDTEYHGENSDLLIALHARRSAKAVKAFAEQHPDRPLVLALTGTDLYRDLGRSPAAAQSIELADRLILLQPEARAMLPPAARRKARVIYQSVENSRRPTRPTARFFDVCVVGHLRPVKDPFRAALAVRKLPNSSRIRVVQIGQALEPPMAARAAREQQRNPRYLWLGGRPRGETLERLARSQVMVISSRMEGGANVVGEAATLGIPILASRVDGNVGLLSRRHPGLFQVGDTAALRELLLRAETDAAFYLRLKKASQRLAPWFTPERERRAWRGLLREFRF